MDRPTQLGIAAGPMFGTQPLTGQTSDPSLLSLARSSLTPIEVGHCRSCFRVQALGCLVSRTSRSSNGSWLPGSVQLQLQGPTCPTQALYLVGWRFSLPSLRLMPGLAWPNLTSSTRPRQPPGERSSC